MGRMKAAVLLAVAAAPFAEAQNETSSSSMETFPPKGAPSMAVDEVAFQCLRARGAAVTEYRFAEMIVKAVNGSGHCVDYTYDPLDVPSARAFDQNAARAEGLFGTSVLGGVDGLNNTEFGAKALATYVVKFGAPIEYCGFAFVTGTQPASDCLAWVVTGHPAAAQSPREYWVLHEQASGGNVVPTARAARTPEFQALLPEQGECAGVTRCPSGQSCVDPDVDVGLDWYCVCDWPLSGRASRAAASCQIDECSLDNVGDVCRSAGQYCIDGDVEVLGDWTCVCPPSAASPNPAVAKAAACEYTGGCRDNHATCNAEGKVCVDVGASGYECQCLHPEGETGARGCVRDECTLNALRCTAAGQGCRDPNPNVRGDWRCECQGSTFGFGVAGPAVGCASAAQACVENGAVCAAAGQVCRVGDGTWFCQCPPPSTGAAGERAPAAACAWNECIAQGAYCQDAGQSCVDPVQTYASLADWQCRCGGSSAAAATAALASCPAQGDCTRFGSTCTAHGQRCADPLNNADGDFQCLCVAPETGAAGANRAAVCTLDECAEAGAACAQAGQLCVDNGVGLGDWTCLCVRPAQGIGLAKPAGCLYTQDNGGCHTHAEVCAAKGQICIDHPVAPGEWSCACVPPLSGVPGAKAAAVCALDECDGAGAVCQEAGQLCVDGSPAIGDFECRCSGAATGSPAVGKPAACTAGQCGNGVCERAGQMCEVDPNGGFTCRCVPPAVGAPGVRSPAACAADHCALYSHICEAVGQECVNVNGALRRTWECRCQGSSTGAQREGVAVCAARRECTEHRQVCEAAGQVCVDPDDAVVGDWECHCAAPSFGAPGKQAASAACAYDACADDRNEHVCYAQAADCAAVGGGSRGVECTPFPAAGACKAHFRTCTDAGQKCVDVAGSATEFDCQCKYNAALANRGGAVDRCYFGAPEVERGVAGDDDDDEGCTWWCVLLFVMGGLFLCAAVAVLILKRRQAQAAQQNLDFIGAEFKPLDKAAPTPADIEDAPRHEMQEVYEAPPPAPVTPDPRPLPATSTPPQARLEKPPSVSLAPPKPRAASGGVATPPERVGLSPGYDPTPSPPAPAAQPELKMKGVMSGELAAPPLPGGRAGAVLPPIGATLGRSPSRTPQYTSPGSPPPAQILPPSQLQSPATNTWYKHATPQPALPDSQLRHRQGPSTAWTSTGWKASPQLQQARPAPLPTSTIVI